MIRFMIGQVDFQECEALVDGLDQAGPTSEGVDGTDAADGDAAAAVGDFIMNVAGGHHGLGAIAELRLVQTALDAALAVSQFLSYDRVHSKSSRGFGVGETRYSIKHRKSQGISSFSEKTSTQCRRLRLLKG